MFNKIVISYKENFLPIWKDEYSIQADSFFWTTSKVQCADRGSYVLGAQMADSAVLTIQCMPILKI
jgi:hypothetical protein